MSTISTSYKPVNKKKKIHPQKFALLIACASIMMMFASLSSAYIVRQAAGNWLEFELPTLFYANTLTIVLSSICLYFSEKSFKKGKEMPYKILLALTFVLGIVFVFLQYKAWIAMDSAGIVFNGNPAGSFIYVISGVHAAHVIGGIIVLAVALIQATMLPFYVSELRLRRLNLSSFYWHFVGILWIYLLVFFFLQH